MNSSRPVYVVFDFDGTLSKTGGGALVRSPEYKAAMHRDDDATRAVVAKLQDELKANIAVYEAQLQELEGRRDTESTHIRLTINPLLQTAKDQLRMCTIDNPYDVRAIATFPRVKDEYLTIAERIQSKLDEPKFAMTPGAVQLLKDLLAMQNVHPNLHVIGASKNHIEYIEALLHVNGADIKDLRENMPFFDLLNGGGNKGETVKKNIKEPGTVIMVDDDPAERASVKRTIATINAYQSNPEEKFTYQAPEFAAGQLKPETIMSLVQEALKAPQPPQPTAVKSEQQTEEHVTLRK